MDSLNTIPNSGSFGYISEKLNDNFSKVGQSLTTLENVAIANKGYFDTLASLQAAFPSPKAGNIAYVANVASSTGYYIYNVVSGVWTATATEAPAVGVAISDYAQHGYLSSPKTLKEVDDEVVQLVGYSNNLPKKIVGIIEQNITNIYYGYNEGNILHASASYKTFIIDNTGGYIKQLIITAKRFNSSNPLNGYIVGIKPDNSYVILHTANNGDKEDYDFIFDTDFSPYKTIWVTAYLGGGTNGIIIANPSVTVLKDGIFEVNNYNTFNGYNEGGTLIANGLYKTFIIDNTYSDLAQLIITAKRFNSSNPLNGYIVGIKPDNSYVILHTANNGDKEDYDFIFDTDFSPYKTIWVTAYLGGGTNGIDVSPVLREVRESVDDVKSYINMRITVINKGNIILYDKGFREYNTEAQNAAIFNNAFIEAKADRKTIEIPEGLYDVSNVQIKGGVSFFGKDKNTILRSASANPIFIYDAVEAQSYIESNQLGTNDPANQGVEIGHFMLSGNGIGTKGIILNNIAYSNFERIYMTGFTDVCLDSKGMLLCNFNDVQFTQSANGVRSTISDNLMFWSNLVNFTNCKFRYLTGIAVDWSKGAGIHFIGTDLSAIGTAGNLSTGVFRLRDMSTEDTPNGVKGIDLSIKNGWSEQLYGGFYLDIANSLGKTSMRDCSILRSLNVGDMQKGIINNGATVMLDGVQLSGLNVETTNNGKTYVLYSNVETHSETTGGTYIIII